MASSISRCDRKGRPGTRGGGRQTRRHCRLSLGRDAPRGSRAIRYCFPAVVIVRRYAGRPATGASGQSRIAHPSKLGAVRPR